MGMNVSASDWHGWVTEQPNCQPTVIHCGGEQRTFIKTAAQQVCDALVIGKFFQYSPLIILLLADQVPQPTGSVTLPIPEHYGLILLDI